MIESETYLQRLTGTYVLKFNEVCDCWQMLKCIAHRAVKYVELFLPLQCYYNITSNVVVFHEGLSIFVSN